MTKHNLDIRAAAKSNGVCLWEIAEKIGVSEPTFSRWLRRELSDELKTKVKAAIDEIKNNYSSKNEVDSETYNSADYAVNGNN